MGGSISILVGDARVPVPGRCRRGKDSGYLRLYNDEAGCTLAVIPHARQTNLKASKNGGLRFRGLLHSVLGDINTRLDRIQMSAGSVRDNFERWRDLHP